MKIAFVYDTAFPWVTGGAERRIYEIGTRLAKRGHDVHVFSLGYWMQDERYKDQEVIEYDNITYHSVGKAKKLYNDDSTRSIKEALYFSRKILTKANFKDFDIIDCQNFPYFSCYTSKLKTMRTDAKLVITVHEVWNDYWYEYMGKKGFFGKIVEKGIFRLTDNYICVSKLTESNLLENHRPKNIEIIANGVNTKKITYLNPSDKFSDVLYAGRLIPEKHVELLVKAMNKVTDIHPFAKCFIVGEGPSRIDLERLVSSYELEDNVIFMDFLDNQEDLYSLMKSSTVFVLPSEREGFGIVLIEANACGLPVITINNPMNAAKDLITSDNGCVINNNVDNLAKIINFYIEEGLNRNMRNNCRTYAKKFDWDHITSITENYYSDILKI